MYDGLMGNVDRKGKSVVLDVESIGRGREMFFVGDSKFRCCEY